MHLLCRRVIRLLHVDKLLLYFASGSVMAVIVWWLDLQLPMQSVPITTNVASSNLVQGEVYHII
jgi:hypothetical protein